MVFAFAPRKVKVCAACVAFLVVPRTFWESNLQEKQGPRVVHPLVVFGPQVPNLRRWDWGGCQEGPGVPGATGGLGNVLFRGKNNQHELRTPKKHFEPQEWESKWVDAGLVDRPAERSGEFHQGQLDGAVVRGTADACHSLKLGGLWRP